jgi:hypothetical protein
LHADYHRPTDTWDKIDAPNSARLLEMVAELATELRNGPDKPAFSVAATP